MNGLNATELYTRKNGLGSGQLAQLVGVSS